MINESKLPSLGYTRNEWFDRSDPKDTHDTLNFIEYKKPISDDFYISICYGYYAEHEKDFKPLEQTVELIGGGCSLPLPPDLDYLEKVHQLLSTPIVK